jgi:hypothetical protein
VPPEIQQVTLSTIGDGAAGELFIDALAKVLDNVQDPNTDAKAKREIHLKFTVSADEERRVGQIEVTCTQKLAGVRGVAVGVYLGKQDGINVAVEAPRQPDMFPTAKSLLRTVGAATKESA